MSLTTASQDSLSGRSRSPRRLRFGLSAALATAALAGSALIGVGFAAGADSTARQSSLRQLTLEQSSIGSAAVPYAALLSTMAGRSIMADAGLPALSGLGLAPASPVRLPDDSGRERGVMIASVAPESPAAKAGLRVHDVVIRYDHQDVYSPEQLMQLVGERREAGDVVVTFLRGGNELETKMTLGSTAALGLAGGGAGGVVGGVAGGVAGGARFAWTSELGRWFPWALPETWRAWLDTDRPSFQSASTRR